MSPRAYEGKPRGGTYKFASGSRGIPVGSFTMPSIWITSLYLHTRIITVKKGGEGGGDSLGLGHKLGEYPDIVQEALCIRYPLPPRV